MFKDSEKTVLNEIFVNDQDNTKLDLEKASYYLSFIADPVGFQKRSTIMVLLKGAKM